MRSHATKSGKRGLAVRRLEAEALLVRVIALVLVAASFAVLPAGALPDGCRDITQASIQVDKYHMFGTAYEFWEESNGLAGLQRVSTWCAPGYTLPADTCITHSENYALVACLSTYPSSLA